MGEIASCGAAVPPRGRPRCQTPARGVPTIYEVAWQARPTTMATASYLTGKSTATQPHPRATASYLTGKSTTTQPHPRATARVPSPPPHRTRPYKDTEQLIVLRRLCKGGCGVVRSCG